MGEASEQPPQLGGFEVAYAGKDGELSPQDLSQLNPMAGGLELEKFAAVCSHEDLAKKFGTSLETGLTSQRADEILKDPKGPGLNQLKQTPPPGFVMLFVLQLISFVILLLFGAAFASIIVNATGDKKEDPLSYSTGIVIFILILLNAGIAAKVEASANGALDALSKLSQASIKVLRDGKELQVATNTIVPGDIVLLETGDLIPADVRLLEAKDFKVSEMPLTGEPDDVSKTDKVKTAHGDGPKKLVPETMAFSSCDLKSGTGRGLVVSTAMNTRIGNIAAMLQNGDKVQCGCLPDTSADQTPLQKNIGLLGARIGIGAIFICVICFGIGLALKTVDPEVDQESANYFDSALFMILIAVTLAVAAIPEGIPLCVTISLSIGCQEMCNVQVRVRKLAAVETLGSASVICTDKTGTLTEGKMTLREMWTMDKKYAVSGQGFDPTDGMVTLLGSNDDAKSNPGVRSTLFAALLCSTAKIEYKEKEGNNSGVKQWLGEGNSSEIPLIVGAKKVGFDGQEVKQKHKRVLDVPFSSSRKMMLTVSEVSMSSLGEGGVALPPGTDLVSVCKGAPNFILDACKGIVNSSGAFEELTAAKRAEVMGVVDEYSEKALRVLAVGIVPFEKLPVDPNSEEMSMDDKFAACRNGLQLVGLVASIDPERQGVPQAVLDARGASIRVIMITGDYLKTAIAIAFNCNILQEEDRNDGKVDAVDCGTLRPNGAYLADKEIDKLTSRTKVFARAQPEDKMVIVNSLKRQNLVCAMTGDGVNDAPALKAADIGVAMNIQGTEVAKGAAAMVLIDDNFTNIVKAVEKGRIIYAGIQKFVAFIMSVHIAEVVQIFFCVVSGIPIMRSPIQILFLILVTDLPPSIALGMEPGEPGILKLRPRPKDEPIILPWMWISVCANGVFMSIVIIAIYMWSLQHFCGTMKCIGPANEDFLMQARTTAFVSLVYAENIRAYLSRSFNRPVWVKLCANRVMLLAVVLAQLFLYIAVFTPGLSTKILRLDGRFWFDTDTGKGIGGFGWAVSLLGPVGVTVLCESFKLVTARQMAAYQKALRERQELEEKQRLSGESQKQDSPMIGA
jgi:potassium/sodium efflux P-type ATPase